MILLVYLRNCLYLCSMKNSDIAKILLEYRQWERQWMMFDSNPRGTKRPPSYEDFILSLEQKYGDN